LAGSTIGCARLIELHGKPSGYDRAERKDLTAPTIDGFWHYCSGIDNQPHGDRANSRRKWSMRSFKSSRGGYAGLSPDMRERHHDAFKIRR
jgi:hypothetical protein